MPAMASQIPSVPWLGFMAQESHVLGRMLCGVVSSGHELQIFLFLKGQALLSNF
jgi:hypothetical protein